MSGRTIRGLAATIGAVLISVGTASAQAPVLAQPGVVGTTATLVWTATASATGYRIDYGTAAGVYSGSLTVGAITTYTASASNGVYFVRVVALPGGEASNEIRLQLPAPPSAPAALSVARNGTNIAATWTVGVGGGVPTGYRLIAGLTSGGSDFILPTGTNTGFSGGPAPANTYYFRVVAFNAAGDSAPSSEVVVAMPSGGACDPLALPVTASAFSGFVSVSWPTLTGVARYNLDATLNGAPAASMVLAGNTSRVAQSATLGTYGISVRAVLACGSESPLNTVTVVNDGGSGTGPRTPNPAPGTTLRAPDRSSVVRRLAAARPDLLNASCHERPGGNNRFLFELVQELRKEDSRWGLNWKRGNSGDMSQDIVGYNISALPDEGATTGPTRSTYNIEIFDVIGNHCPISGSPTANWENVTDKTIDPGQTRAVWTLRPYIEAGYIP